MSRMSTIIASVILLEVAFGTFFTYKVRRDWTSVTKSDIDNVCLLNRTIGCSVWYNRQKSWILKRFPADYCVQLQRYTQQIQPILFCFDMLYRYRPLWFHQDYTTIRNRHRVGLSWPMRGHYGTGVSSDLHLCCWEKLKTLQLAGFGRTIGSILL